MSTVPVIYRQALTGERLRHYGNWAKYVPLPLLQRVGDRLPEKSLWQTTIPCGERAAELAVVACPRGESRLPPESELMQAPIVYSHNLETGRKNRAVGRALALGLLRQLLPSLTRQLELLGDRLSVALAVSERERTYWVLGVEPYARLITVFLRKNERTKALGQAGVAVRSVGYDAGRVDAHVMIISPECLPAVKRLTLRQGTLLVSTDGLSLEPFLGCLSLELSLPAQLGMPGVIWADGNDQFPVLETVLIAAFLAGRLADWPVNISRQITLMDRAYAWSQWPSAYRLLSEGKAPTGGEIE